MKLAIINFQNEIRILLLCVVYLIIQAEFIWFQWLNVSVDDRFGIRIRAGGGKVHALCDKVLEKT